MPGFTHLHVHSEYSLLDGLTRVPDLVRNASERGFDAIALTDHGVMFGAIQFYSEAKKAGVKPILGCEFYVASRSRHDRDTKVDARSHHLTVLARDIAGYRNLTTLATLAQIEGFYYKPRVDRELLERHAEGLIVLSGCPSAEVGRLILDGNRAAARDAMAWHRDVFGANYFVELQRHDLDFLPALNLELISLATELGIPMVATNDVHYARAEDVVAHEVLLCVQTGTTMTNTSRMRLGSNTFYLRTEAEMRELFADLPAAISNTALIAEMCDVEFEFGSYKLPVFAVPDGETAAGYLRRQCEEGMTLRFGDPSQEVRARLDYELGVIHQMGFDDYFLIVWDLCRFARREGIWWNVRGSAAGALVSYCLMITTLDPLEHDLIFERFLNPERVSMPDIDLDFPDDQRDLVMRYAYDKYGHDRVAQIITFGTMGARAAVRDAGRALDMPLSRVDPVARLIPAISGKPCRIQDALRSPTKDEPNEFYAPDLVEMVAAEDDIARLLETAQSLEGVARHASTHAAGVVISDRPLLDYLPLHRATGSDEGAIPLTQFPMHDVERLGLLKVDVLGLATLTVLRKAAELIEEHHGIRYELDNIPLDDPATYELLSSGEVTGLFQVEGAGMRRMLRDMRPTLFGHIMAAIALYRPGPMDKIPSYVARMHGQEEITYRHELLRPILEETYGILVYQEQIIEIARELCGYGMAQADTVRQAVAKKIKDKLDAHHVTFLDGAEARGVPRKVTEKIWQDIETFARYGFNKAHAANYASLVCQTAFLKAHYPVEYMTALLAVERDDTDKVGLITADCHRLGIKLLRPSVQRSGINFRIEPLEERHWTAGITRKRGIRFGLAAVKNVGEGAVEAIVAGRVAGPFVDLEDFCRRTDLRVVGRRALECLIRVGALEDFGARAGLLDMLDKIVGYSASHHEASERGQLSMFGGGSAPEALLGAVPHIEVARRDELAAEKELIGLYLSEHPLHRLMEAVSDRVTALVSDLDGDLVGKPVTLAGLIVDARRITTKKGAAMAFARLTDLQGSVDLTIFPRVLEATRDLWTEDRLVLLKGRLEQRDDRLQVVVDEAWDFDVVMAEEGASPPVPAATNGAKPAAAPTDAPTEMAEPPEWATAAHEPAEVTPTAAAAHEPVALTPKATAAPRPVAFTPRATAAPRPSSEPSSSYQLTITLPRTPDMDEDIVLLKQVYAALTDYQGFDRFAVRVENESGMVELDFPNTTTRYCVSLVQRIEELIGAGRLRADTV